MRQDNPYWHPKNQTYYYSVNYDKLQELIEKVENQFEKAKNAETPENVRIEDFTRLSVEDFSDTKCCELSQLNTDITSIKNYSKDQSHPTLPSVCDDSTETNQDKRTVNKLELTKVLDFAAKKKVDSVKSKVIEKDKSFGQVEENINQNIGTSSQNDKSVQEPVQVEADGRGLGGFPAEPKAQVRQLRCQPSFRRLAVKDGCSSDASTLRVVQRPVQEVEKPKLKKTPKGTKPNRKGQAPWKDEGQFKRFYRALVQALPIVGGKLAKLSPGAI